MTLPVDAEDILQKQILLNALMAIKEKPALSQVGICPNIEYATLNVPGTNDYRISKFFKAIAKTWPKFSGDLGYPVPAPFGVAKSGYQAYYSYSEDSMWEGDYGALRKELLNYAISALEKELHA